MKRSIVKYVLMVFAVILCGPMWVLNAADLKLAAVFSDHMVLQRDKSVPVWGWGDPGEQIAVEFSGSKQIVSADSSGKWTAKLEPMKANAEPQTMRIQGGTADRQIQVEDVLVGEVWLGSGQSNMQWPASKAANFEKEKAGASLPLIRMFTEKSAAAKTAAQDASGQWVVCSPDTVGDFSATLFFFGRELHGELKLPVGLINSSVGGTPIESWIAEDVQNANPELKAAVDKKAEEEALKVPMLKENYAKAIAKWNKDVEKAKAEGRPEPKKPGDPLVRRANRGGAGGLFNGKIAPLIPYAIRGVVWYQGESNALNGEAALYRIQLPLLVNDWRRRWNEELPFGWVQLPNFKRASEGWMLVQEAMLKALSLPRTGMAITVDIGEATNIHPGNKQDVGKRLALWALGDVYGQKVVATSGPLPAGHEVKGNEVIVSFTHCDGGLNAREGELKGFVIAGEDRQWKPAKARVEGEKVVLASTEVLKPVAVRYAWAAWPDCNLYNGVGLPASPFRTDDWVEDQGTKQ